MKKTGRLFPLLLAVLLLVSGCGNGKQLRMGTGNVAGNYYAYGNVLKQEVEKQDGAGLTVEVKETAGSAANLRLMKEGFLDMAIVQSDVLTDAMQGKGMFEGNAYEDVRILAGLYTEQCQLVVPADSSVQKVEDLKGMRVSTGEKESGVSLVAGEVLKAAGLAESMLKVSSLSFADSADALAKGEIDAFFLMAGAPVNAVSELAKQMDVRLIALDERTISYMTGLYDGYVEAVVKAGTYPGLEEDVRTIGVRAVLVADKKVSSAAAEKMTQCLFEQAAQFRYATAVAEDFSLQSATEQLPGFFHDGAAAYYEKKSVSVETDESTGRRHYIFGGQDQ